MAVSPGYQAFVQEQLGKFATITSRRLFGGVGFYANEFYFAIIVDDTLYFKVDDSNRPDFEAVGMGPFLPFGDPDRPMQYYQVPAEVLEDEDQLRTWVEKSVAVARKKKRRKRKKKATG